MRILILFINLFVALFLQAATAADKDCDSLARNFKLDSQDPYEVLGLSRGATEAEVKMARKAGVKRFHPDVNKDDKAAEEKFKKIMAAYDSIMNSSVDSGPEPESRPDQSMDFVDQVMTYTRTYWFEKPVIRIFGREAEFSFLISGKRYEPAQNDFADYRAMFEEPYQRPADYLTKNFPQLLNLLQLELPQGASDERRLSRFTAPQIESYRNELKMRLNSMFRSLSSVPAQTAVYGILVNDMEVERFKKGDLGVGLAVATIVKEMLPFIVQRTQNLKSTAMDTLMYQLKRLGMLPIELDDQRTPQGLRKQLPEWIRGELHPVTYLRQVNRLLLLTENGEARREILETTGRDYLARFGGTYAHYLAFLLVYGSDYSYDPILIQSKDEHKPTIYSIVNALKEELGIRAMLDGKERPSLDNHIEPLEFYLQVLSFADQRLPYRAKIENSCYWAIGIPEYFTDSIVRCEYANIKERLKRSRLKAWLDELEVVRHQGQPLDRTALRFADFFNYVRMPKLSATPPQQRLSNGR